MDTLEAGPQMLRVVAKAVAMSPKPVLINRSNSSGVMFLSSGVEVALDHSKEGFVCSC